MLAFKVAVEADQEREDADGEEGCAEGFSDVAETELGFCGCAAVDCGV